jgi:N-glycosylase/DNA lyase
MKARAWHSLKVAPAELRLRATLENGQCFGWQRQPGDAPVWVGVLGRRLLALRETESDCLFRCLGASDDAALLRDELRDFFQLGTPLRPLYEAWSAADERCATVARALPGMRILRQEPVECLFSFICSSNNNIGRIGGMLQALRRTYGTPLTVGAAVGTDEQPPVGHGDAREFYTFPTAERLAAASEADLRGLGLGYRAAYIRQTAAKIVENGAAWLPALRAVEEPDAVRTSLCSLAGVGPKVADCVALFSLDQASAIPVDTHVWDIACRDLDTGLTNVGALARRGMRRAPAEFCGRSTICVRRRK